ncbi:SGNH/GDSL hydrolase family protein [bacterium]|nr:SGNH/GDSL hydrolase family protein [bacterium]
MRNTWLALFLLTALTVCTARAEFFIQDGDVVCFWGNSITDYGIYPRMIENYVVTRHPDWNVKFFNLGWGGDRTMNVGRLRRDIQLCKPTKVCVMLGMNDGEYKPFDPKTLSVYLDSLKTELAIFHENSNPQIMLISATPYDLRVRLEQVSGRVEDTKALGTLFYPEVLQRYSWELGRLAGLEGCRYVDLNAAFMRHNREVGLADGSFVLTAEGVHPNIDGEFEMGCVILEGMGACDLVAATTIDAAAGTVKQQEGATVEAVKAAAGGLSFTRKAACLPAPAYPSTRALTQRILEWPDKLNSDLLKVEGLAAGWYSLEIDGKPIDILPASDLAAGVNLSRYPNTPQMLQAMKVLEAGEKRMAAFYTRWRRVLLEGVGSPRDFTPFKTGVITEALEKDEAAAYAEQHALNKPVAQAYAIKPVKSPAPQPSQFVPASAFLGNLVKVHIQVEAAAVPGFKPPFSLRGNFTYAPQYQWGILESKGYYADIPVLLYDDGTHGDKLAGDGVWSLDMFMRKDSGKLAFGLHDGAYEHLYWNPIERGYYMNPWCEKITVAWDKLLGGKGDDWLGWVDLSKDQSFVWDQAALAKAVAQGLIEK